MEARRKDSSCYAVVRKGRLAGDWNWGTERKTPREAFSVTKSVTSALVGIAVRDGSLEVSDRVFRYVRAWRGTDSRAVTVRHLLSNDSGRFWSLESDYVELGQAPNRTRYAVGLGQQYSPGTAWAYNNAAIQVLDPVLEKATGMPTTDLAADRLFEPLGMTHTPQREFDQHLLRTADHLPQPRPFRPPVRAGETADGQRILSRGYVTKSVGDSSTRHNAAYGYLWWLNRYGLLRGATDQVERGGPTDRPREGRLVPVPRARSTPRSDSGEPWPTASHGPSWSAWGRPRRRCRGTLRPGGRRPRRHLGAALRHPGWRLPAALGEPVRLRDLDDARRPRPARGRTLATTSGSS